MFTTTIILSGNVIVEDVAFSWWVSDGWEPVLTVSHPSYGTERAPLGAGQPLARARAIAKDMVASAHSTRTE
jgi:hypothetical protein